MQCCLSNHELSKTLGVFFHDTVSIYREYLQDLHLSRALTFLSLLNGGYSCPHIKEWGRRARL